MRILDKADSTKPLWVHVFCEEMRLHGQFGVAGEAVTAKIIELPGTLEGLLIYVLDRLERELGRSLVRSALCFILCSHTGLQVGHSCPRASCLVPRTSCCSASFLSPCLMPRPYQHAHASSPPARRWGSCWCCCGRRGRRPCR